VGRASGPVVVTALLVGFGAAPKSPKTKSRTGCLGFRNSSANTANSAKTTEAIKMSLPLIRDRTGGVDEDSPARSGVSAEGAAMGLGLPQVGQAIVPAGDLSSVSNVCPQ
jgi:hypothetical protein